MKKILPLLLLIPCALSAMEKRENKYPDVYLEMTFTLIDKDNNILDTTHHNHLAYYDGSFESNQARNAPKTRSQTGGNRSLSLATTLLNLAVDKKVHFSDDECITLPILKTATIQYTIKRCEAACNWVPAQNATIECDLSEAKKENGYNMPLLLLGLKLNIKATTLRCFILQ